MDGRRSTLNDAFRRYNWLKNNRFRVSLPARCTFCAGVTDGAPVCESCLADLPWRRHTRLRGATEVHASFHYEFPIVECLGRAKLGGDCGLARQLGHWLAARPAVVGADIDVVCAVPLAWSRAVLRGYNQALEIAKPVAAVLARPLHAAALRRRPGLPQRGLGRAARQRNLVGRFVAATDLVGLRILVVDDVTTTGATFREARRALLAAGAASVTAWAVAAVD